MTKTLPKVLHPPARADRPMRDVVRQGGVVFLLRIVGVGLAFLLNVAVARQFGAAGAGLYYLALTVVTVASVIGRFGLDNVLLRDVATGLEQGNWGRVRGSYRLSMAVAAGCSLTAAAAVYGLAPGLADALAEPGLTPLLRVISFGVVPASLLALHVEALKSLHRPVLATLLQALGVPLLTLVLAVVLGRTFGLAGLVVAFIAAQVAVLVVAGVAWRRLTPRTPRPGAVYDLRGLVRRAWPLLWVAVMGTLMQWADLFLLGFWVGPAEVGVYATAVRTAMLTSFVLVAVNTVAAPKFAALYARQDVAGLESLARRTARLAALSALPVLLVFTLCPAPLLGLFGAEFTGGALALTILAAGHYVNVVTGSVGYLLIVSGHEKLLQYNVMAAAAANVLLNVLLIPPYGVVGAALAASLTLAGMNLVSALLVYRKLSFWALPCGARRGV